MAPKFSPLRVVKIVLEKKEKTDQYGFSFYYCEKNWLQSFRNYYTGPARTHMNQMPPFGEYWSVDPPEALGIKSISSEGVLAKYNLEAKEHRLESPSILVTDRIVSINGATDDQMRIQLKKSRRVVLRIQRYEDVFDFYVQKYPGNNIGVELRPMLLSDGIPSGKYRIQTVHGPAIHAIEAMVKRWGRYDLFSSHFPLTFEKKMSKNL